MCTKMPMKRKSGGGGEGEERGEGDFTLQS